MNQDLTFTEFVLKQATNAGIFLGERENPLTGEKNVNLKGAKGALDVLVLLQQKTHGNLTNEESKILNDTVATISGLYEQAVEL